MAKRTKIVATIGPASEDKKILQKLVSEGMNIARLNFSHGDYAWHEKVIKRIREISEKIDVPVGIMADLQGPRIRTLVGENIKVRKGDRFLVSDISIFPDYQKTLELKTIPAAIKAQKIITLFLDCPGIVRKLKAGNNILIADGLVKLKIIKKFQNYIEVEAAEDGIIKNHKGVNIPDAKIPLAAMTKKDRRDLNFALKNNVDFVALSFVSSKRDIISLRRKVRRITGNKKDPTQIVAKIERRDAIRNLNEIIKETDAVMVARGDLGIELDETRVAVLQKEIVEKSLRFGKPVIVATQMLGSMINRSRPTRAEVSDVSNAVVDHADAVMLSEETATGKYPVIAVRTMREIIERTEESPFDDLVHGFLGDARASVSAAVADSAHELSKNAGAKAIVVASVSGFTARMISRHRPEQRIFVMTNNKKTYHQLSLVWGAESFILPDCRTLDELIIRSVGVLKKGKLLKPLDKIVIVTGRPHVKKEHMSLVKIEEIK
jgi:pyruvate kinase